MEEAVDLAVAAGSAEEDADSEEEAVDSEAEAVDSEEDVASEADGASAVDTDASGSWLM